MPNRILVIGATGTIGRALVDHLEENGEKFTVLSRSHEKAEQFIERGIRTAIGALGDWDSVTPLLKKAETVFLLTSPSPQQVEQQNGLIDLAKQCGVNKIVKISAVGAQKGSTIGLLDWHGQTEEHLINSGLNYVILKPHSFMQNMLMNIPTIQKDGVFYQSTGECKVPFIDIRDIAAASYACLTTDEFDNNSYELTGKEAISQQDIASALTESTGKEIKCIDIPLEAHLDGMKQAGLPEWLASDLIGFNRKYIEGEMIEVSDSVEKLTGEQPKTIQDFASSYAHYFI